MNTNEAKEALLLYRGSIDDADPKIQEALAYARRDPELAAWMREQRSSYEAIRSKFREVEPPGDLAERIIRQRPIPFRRPWAQMLKLAAAIVISAGVTALAMNLWQRGTTSLGTEHFR
jgi:ferric-dicitrate binding protein FerR (iron transport regulator)